MGRLAAAALAAAFVLTGCGERPEPVEETAVAYPLEVGRTRLAAEPETVVAGDHAMAQLVELLGKKAPMSGAADLVLAWESSGADFQLGGAEYIARDGSIAEVERSLAEIALLLGDPLRGRDMVRDIEDARAEARRRLAATEPVTVFLDTGFFATVSERSLPGELLREAGGRNIAGATPEPGPFPLRQLVDADPDVYLYTSSSKTSLRFLRANARTRRLSAVRKGRVYEIADELVAPGPRIGEGLLALARLLHPDAFR